MAKCAQCLFGYCDNCTSMIDNLYCECEHELESIDEDSSESGTESEGSDSENMGESSWRKRGAGVRRHKRDAAIRDQQSTGRKRAARLYPLDRSAACEWQNASKDNPCGGGTKPITTGCQNTQQARHHGPNKNTLDNERGNVHRICHVHHNRWHAANDPDYTLDGGMIRGD